MNCFSVEEYLKLENKIKLKAASGYEDALEDLLLLKKAVLAFAHYVYMVNEEQIETRLASGVKTGEELKNTVAHFDATRHNAHESAIVNSNMLNRIASAYGVEHIFTGDPSNRREVGDFCGQITAWFFENRYS